MARSRADAIASAVTRRRMIFGLGAGATALLAAACGETQVRYVQKVVEKRVEVPVVQEKIKLVEKEVPVIREKVKFIEKVVEKPVPQKIKTVTALLITNDMILGTRYFNRTVIDRFEQANPTIRLRATMAPYRAIMKKVSVEVAAGTITDIFGMDGVLWARYAASGAALNLTPLIKRDAKAIAPVASLLKNFTDPKGNTWAMPATLGTTGLAFNKGLFDRFGLPYPDDTLQWNPRDGGNFVELAHKLTRPDEEIWGWWYTGQITADTLCYLKQNQGSWLDPTMTKSAVLEPNSLEAFQFLHDLVHKYKVSPLPQDARMVDRKRGGRHWLFLTGKAAMFNLLLGQVSAWNPKTISDLVKVDAQVLPMGKQRASSSGSSLYQIASASKDPETAWTFLKWWYNDLDSQVGVWTDWKYGLPPARSAWSDPRLKQPAGSPLQNIKPFLEVYEKEYGFGHEVNPVWSQYMRAFRNEFNPSMEGKKPMKIAMEAAHPLIQNILDTKLPDSWR